ncbi:hypothetical protein M433DRAFT_153061 [Acidomyces richmondensis BFW]|nr:MAG: hypothetical protein FE78DRAFT_90344 [Acidomyces sp. 'richmondensis']KYG46712.1 hypothetical protein M433DRAFT_153061 [Acidomyces richmondensis BFW]
MARIIRVAAAQMGATHRTDERNKTLGRILALLHEASQKGAEVVLFPEIAIHHGRCRSLSCLSDTFTLQTSHEAAGMGLCHPYSFSLFHAL